MTTLPSTTARRDDVDRLIESAHLLPTHDRGLLKLVYGRGASCVDLAGLTGDDPRRVRRRLNAIIKRMRSPVFRFAAARPHRVPRAAWLVIVDGLSLREAARWSGVSLHEVRRRVAGVRQHMKGA